MQRILSNLLFGLLLLIPWATCQYSQSGGTSQCRCLAGQSCFPTTAQWNAFNATIGGRLINPVPTAYPCYPQTSNPATCSVIQANDLLPTFRATLPGTMQSWNWEENGMERCPMELFNVSNSQCQQGRVPTYGVNATSVDDIQKALAFGIQHNLRIFVKNSGHDYLGRSTSAGSFMIWTFNMQTTTVNASWSPANCPQVTARPAITAAAGSNFGVIYPLIDTVYPQYLMSGGYTYTVGSSGGYFMGGGGHSKLGPTYGLAVDNIFQIEVVTVDGQLHVVNQCQEPDLFWALKGGGSGTYGVVTSVTYQLYPAPAAWTALEFYVVPTGNYAPGNPAGNGNPAFALTNQQFINLMTIYFQQGNVIDQARWGGYFEANPYIGFVGSWIFPASLATMNQSITTFTQAFMPLQQAGLVTITMNVTQPTSFWGWRKNHKWAGPLDIDFTGFRGVLGSRLIPLSALSDPVTLATNVAAALNHSQFLVGLMVAGRGVRERGSNGTNSSETPGWRTAFVHLVFLTVWNYDTPDTQIAQMEDDLMTGVDILTQAYPASGAYMNEAYIMTDYKNQFWGATNYNRLLGIKQQYDPNGVFVCTQCVGSESWSSDGNCKIQSY